MPCHLISDAHEWTNVGNTVLRYNSVKISPRERAWFKQRGKKTLLSFTTLYLNIYLIACSIIGSFTLLKYL